MTATGRLNDDLVSRALSFPETHMNVVTVAVTLRDGRTFAGVELAGGSEVIRVRGRSDVPFDAADVVDVQDDSGHG